jgi:hypothetical protein
MLDASESGGHSFRTWWTKLSSLVDKAVNICWTLVEAEAIVKIQGPFTCFASCDPDTKAVPVSS